MRDKFALIFTVALVCLYTTSAVAAPAGAGHRNAAIGNQASLGAQFGRAGTVQQVQTPPPAAPAPEQPQVRDIRPDFIEIYNAYRQSLADAQNMCLAGQASVENIVGELGGLIGASVAQIGGGAVAAGAGAVNIVRTQKQIDEERELMPYVAKVTCLERENIKTEIIRILITECGQPPAGELTAVNTSVERIIEACVTEILTGVAAAEATEGANAS
jgi:hypothetical protein